MHQLHADDLVFGDGCRPVVATKCVSTRLLYHYGLLAYAVWVRLKADDRYQTRARCRKQTAVPRNVACSGRLVGLARSSCRSSRFVR